MIKVEVTEDFTLRRFNELKNIARKNQDKPGKLFKGDVFECEEDLVNYLSGNNALKKSFVKVIEVLPKVEAKIEYHEEKKKPGVSMKLELEDVEVIAEELNKATKKPTKGKKSKK